MCNRVCKFNEYEDVGNLVPKFCFTANEGGQCPHLDVDHGFWACNYDCFAQKDIVGKEA